MPLPPNLMAQFNKAATPIGEPPKSAPSTSPMMEQFSKVATPMDQAPTGAQPPGSWLSSLGHGAVEGLRESIDWPAQELATGVGALAHAAGLAPDWHPG